MLKRTPEWVADACVVCRWWSHPNGVLTKVFIEGLMNSRLAKIKINWSLTDDQVNHQITNPDVLLESMPVVSGAGKWAINQIKYGIHLKFTKMKRNFEELKKVQPNPKSKESRNWEARNHEYIDGRVESAVSWATYHLLFSRRRDRRRIARKDEQI